MVQQSMPDMTQEPQPVPFAPVESPVTLYPGKVMHARLNPFGHRFTYRVFTCLFDIDRLDDAAGMSAIFSVNRFNLVSFHERDHCPGGDTTQGLRARVDTMLETCGLDRPAAVRLLAYPRLFGFVFNPLSVYFCHDDDGALQTVIYEVRNTFGEHHSYVCAIEPGQLTDAGVRQSREKIFYVSPFIDLGARYHFRVLPPGESVRVRIFETENDAPLLSATFSGEARPFTTATLAGQLARLPLMTLSIVASIHWQALKLWWKGAKFHSRGKPPEPVSHRDGLAHAAR